jgi:hypothetical protein
MAPRTVTALVLCPDSEPGVGVEHKIAGLTVGERLLLALSHEGVGRVAFVGNGPRPVSSRADIEAAMGAPDDEQVGHYVATNTELRYRSGELGMLLVLDGGAVVEMSVGLWDEIFLVEGCL